MRIGVAVDASTDLSPEFIEAQRITVLPVTVHLGDSTFVDTRDPATTLAFYQRRLAERAADAQTSALPAEAIEKLFLERLVLQQDYVFLVTLTETRSPTCGNGRRAASLLLRSHANVRAGAGVPGGFALRVVDSQSLFAAPAVLAWEAVRLAREGRTPSDIRKRLDDLAFHCCAYLVPDNLRYIRKRASKRGERSVGWLAHLLASVLSIKPILRNHRAQTATVAKVRHFGRACERLFRHAERQIERGLLVPVVCISYGGDPSAIASLPGYAALAETARGRGVTLMTAMMSAAAAVNVGSGGLSLGYCAESAAFA